MEEITDKLMMTSTEKIEIESVDLPNEAAR
jgi:hypothetical protein